MRDRALIARLLIAVIVTAFCQGMAPATAAASSGKARRTYEAAVRDLSAFLHAYQEAVARGTPDAVSGFWADDAVVAEDSRPAVPFRHFLGRTLPSILEGKTPATVVDSEIHISAEGLSSEAYASQRFRLAEGNNRRGRSHDWIFEQKWTFEKRADRWVVQRLEFRTHAANADGRSEDPAGHQGRHPNP